MYYNCCILSNSSFMFIYSLSYTAITRHQKYKIFFFVTTFIMQWMCKLDNCNSWQIYFFLLALFIMLNLYLFIAQASTLDKYIKQSFVWLCVCIYIYYDTNLCVTYLHTGKISSRHYKSLFPCVVLRNCTLLFLTAY